MKEAKELERQEEEQEAVPTYTGMDQSSLKVQWKEKCYFTKEALQSIFKPWGIVEGVTHLSEREAVVIFRHKDSVRSIVKEDEMLRENFTQWSKFSTSEAQKLELQEKTSKMETDELEKAKSWRLATKKVQEPTLDELEQLLESKLS